MPAFREKESWITRLVGRIKTANQARASQNMRRAAARDLRALGPAALRDIGFEPGWTEDAAPGEGRPTDAGVREEALKAGEDDSAWAQATPPKLWRVDAPSLDQATLIRVGARSAHDGVAPARPAHRPVFGAATPAVCGCEI